MSICPPDGAETGTTFIAKFPAGSVEVGVEISGGAGGIIIETVTPLTSVTNS